MGDLFIGDLLNKLQKQLNKENGIKKTTDQFKPLGCMEQFNSKETYGEGYLNKLIKPMYESYLKDKVQTKLTKETLNKIIHSPEKNAASLNINNNAFSIYIYLSISHQYFGFSKNDKDTFVKKLFGSETQAPTIPMIHLLWDIFIKWCEVEDKMTNQDLTEIKKILGKKKLSGDQLQTFLKILDPNYLFNFIAWLKLYFIEIVKADVKLCCIIHKFLLSLDSFKKNERLMALFKEAETQKNKLCNPVIPQEAPILSEKPGVSQEAPIPSGPPSENGVKGVPLPVGKGVGEDKAEEKEADPTQPEEKEDLPQSGSENTSVPVQDKYIDTKPYDLDSALTLIYFTGDVLFQIHSVAPSIFEAINKHIMEIEGVNSSGVDIEDINRTMEKLSDINFRDIKVSVDRFIKQSNVDKWSTNMPIFFSILNIYNTTNHYLRKVIQDDDDVTEPTYTLFPKFNILDQGHIGSNVSNLFDQIDTIKKVGTSDLRVKETINLMNKMNNIMTGMVVCRQLVNQGNETIRSMRDFILVEDKKIKNRYNIIGYNEDLNVYVPLYSEFGGKFSKIQQVGNTTMMGFFDKDYTVGQNVDPVEFGVYRGNNMKINSELLKEVGGNKVQTIDPTLIPEINNFISESEKAKVNLEIKNYLSNVDVEFTVTADDEEDEKNTTFKARLIVNNQVLTEFDVEITHDVAKNPQLGKDQQLQRKNIPAMIVSRCSLPICSIMMAQSVKVGVGGITSSGGINTSEIKDVPVLNLYSHDVHSLEGNLAILLIPIYESFTKVDVVSSISKPLKNIFKRAFSAPKRSMYMLSIPEIEKLRKCPESLSKVYEIMMKELNIL